MPDIPILPPPSRTVAWVLTGKRYLPDLLPRQRVLPTTEASNMNSKEIEALLTSMGGSLNSLQDATAALVQAVGTLATNLNAVTGNVSTLTGNVSSLAVTVGTMNGNVNDIETKLDAHIASGGTGGGGTPTPTTPVSVVSPLTLGTYTDTASTTDDFQPLTSQATGTNSPTLWNFVDGSVVNDVSVRLGLYGTFSVVRASGLVTYTPDDAAINGYDGQPTVDTAQLVATNAGGNSAPAAVTVNIVGQAEDTIEVFAVETGETPVDMTTPLASVPADNNVTVVNNTSVPLKVYF